MKSLFVALVLLLPISAHAEYNCFNNSTSKSEDLNAASACMQAQEANRRDQQLLAIIKQMAQDVTMIKQQLEKIKK
ncbi:MAG: hypothetical protein NT091_00605 [Candidatus Falkowbacteria bacterium]|nr:hypothetical protein [Candidatus Falkowbacteria bacterium]